MNDRQDWNQLYTELETTLTEAQLQQLLAEARRLRASNTPRARAISWLATLSGLTLITGSMIYLTMPGAPFLPRLITAAIAGYLTALVALAIRFFQDWQSELITIKTKTT